MACTIARTAGRLATCVSPTPMTANSDRAAPASKLIQTAPSAAAIQIQCTFHNDPRLIAGASAIAAHVGGHGGLSERAREDLAAAAIEACREVFRLGPNRGPLPAAKLVAESFPDRVKVSVELSPTARGAVRPEPAARRPAKSATAKKVKAFATALVDDVQQEIREGRACITLVKYVAVRSRPRV
jgi:hypothetical protein